MTINWIETNPGSPDYIANKPIIPETIEIKKDPIANGTYLDNAGNYTNPVDLEFTANLSWDTLVWEDVYWSTGVIKINDKADTIHYHDDLYYRKADIDTAISNINISNYYTKAEVNALDTEITEHSHTVNDIIDLNIYNGSVLPNAGNVVALDSYKRLPKVDGSNLYNLSLGNIGGLSTTEGSSKFLNGTGNYSRVDYNNIINTPTDIISGYFIDDSTMSGSISNIPTSEVVVNYVTDFAADYLLYKHNNLIDVDAASARYNLGLGTAAQYDIVQGDMGLTWGGGTNVIPSATTMMQWVIDYVAYAGGGGSGSVTVNGVDTFNELTDVDNLPGDSNKFLNGLGSWTTITASGEVNVQADWNETNSSSDAYIRNKPNVSDAALRSIRETMGNWEEWEFDTKIPTCRAVYEILLLAFTEFSKALTWQKG